MLPAASKPRLLLHRNRTIPPKAPIPTANLCVRWFAGRLWPALPAHGKDLASPGTTVRIADWTAHPCSGNQSVYSTPTDLDSNMDRPPLDTSDNGSRT